jgi:hypothetical protein
MTGRKTVLIVLAVLGAWVVVCIAGGLFLARHARRLVTGPVGLSKSHVGKPIPCGAEVPTTAKLEPLWVGYYRKNLKQAYDKVGKRDPKWDKQATDLMEATAKFQCTARDAPTLKDMLPMARALQKAGCDDPLIQSLIGDVLYFDGRKSEAEPLVRGSLAGLQARHYPPLCLAWAYLDMARLHGEAGSKLESAEFKWRPLAIDAYVRAAAKSNFGPQEQRPLWWEISNLMASEFRRSQAVFVNTMKARPETDQWIFHMVWGKHNYDYGWFYRGGGFIQDVKPEDYQEFEKGMKFARGNFEKAQAEHPEYPEAATYLLNVSKTGATGPMASPRAWFDRAVAAQFDHLPVYYDYMSALLPRWGGSHEAMLSFGKECVETGRFDTQVPKLFYEIILTIAENDRDDSIWQDSQIWPPLQKYCEGKLAWVTAHEPKSVKAVRTVYALVAWRSGHADMARQQLDAMHGELDKPIFDAQWAERAELVVGQIYGLTGARKQQVAQAEQLYAQEKVDEALAAYQALLKVETEKPTQFLLRDRIQSLQWEQRFHANQWVDLDPTPDLVGWDIFQGKFKPLADGKGFIMWPGEQFGLMACMMRPGSWFEVRCDVEFPDRKVKGIEAGFVVDIPLTANPYYDTCRIVRDPPQALFGGGWEPWQEHALSAVPRQCHLRLIQCENRVTMYVDKQTVLQDQKLSDRGFRFKGPHHIAIGGEYWPDRTQPVIYRHIQIHKMTGEALRRGIGIQ